MMQSEYKSNDQPRNSTPSKRALLIEDDHDIAISASLRLRAAGFETRIVGSAEQGLVVAANDPPDVIILDIRLPGMDGLEALRVLRSRDSTRFIPVVALSASVVDQRSALDGGVRFFLKKPYEPGEFVSAVEVAVASKLAPAAPPDGNPSDEIRGDLHNAAQLAGPLVRAPHPESGEPIADSV